MGVKKIVKAVRRNGDKEKDWTEDALQAKKLYEEAKELEKQKRKLAKQESKEEKLQRKEQEKAAEKERKEVEKELKMVEKMAEKQRKEQEKELEKELKEARKEQKRLEKEAKKAAKELERENQQQLQQQERENHRASKMPAEKAGLLVSEEFTAWSDSFVDFDAEMLEAARGNFLDESHHDNDNDINNNNNGGDGGGRSVDTSGNSLSRSEMSHSGASIGRSSRHRQNFSSRRRDCSRMGTSCGGAVSCRRSPSPLRSPSRSRSPSRISPNTPCSVERFMEEISENDFAQRRSASPNSRRSPPVRPKGPPRRAKSYGYDGADYYYENEIDDQHPGLGILVQDNVTEWSRTNPNWVPVRHSVNPTIRRIRDKQQLEWIRNGGVPTEPLDYDDDDDHDEDPRPDADVPNNNRRTSKRSSSQPERGPSPRSSPRRTSKRTSSQPERGPSPRGRKSSAAPSRINRGSVQRSVSPSGRTDASTLPTPRRGRLTRHSSDPLMEDSEEDHHHQNAGADPAKGLARPTALSQNMRARSVDSAFLQDDGGNNKVSLKSARMVF